MIMFSKLSLALPQVCRRITLQKLITSQLTCIRKSHLIPPTQYDVKKAARKFTLRYAIGTQWEVTPLLAVTAFAMGLLCFSIMWALKTKVDTVMTPESRKLRLNLSRTMDLLNPPTLKLIVINQKYDPWPEMDAVQRKMKQAELKLLKNTKVC